MTITAGILIYSLSLDTTIRTNMDGKRDFPVESYEIWRRICHETASSTLWKKIGCWLI